MNKIVQLTHGLRPMMMGFVFLLSASLTQGQTILDVSVSSLNLCEGEAIDVDFVVSASFINGNVFTAELSDEFGAFGSPVSIGTLVASTDGTINATLPAPLTPGTAYRIRVTSTTPATTGPDNTLDITINNPPGDPTVFGNGTWNAYCYDGNNFQTYRGFYVEPSLVFDSRTQWGSNSNPSTAGSYQGCTVPDNQHSVAYMRTNFPCGDYQIDVQGTVDSRGHDDHAELLVDGQVVWTHAGCCDSHLNVWTGFLGPNSTVEFRWREFSGQSYGGLNVTQLNSNSGLAVSSVYDCVTGQYTLAASGGSAFTWSPGTFLNTTIGSPVISTPTSTTTYTVTGTSNCTGNPPASAQITVEPSHTLLDPDQDFGDGEWIAFAYDGNTFNTYSGYYLEPLLTFDSRDRWSSGGSPSDASGYVGCTVPDNQHSTRYKRTNFPCGDYQIDITNHDDNGQLIIDGVVVWNHDGCCDSHTNAWTGFLGPASEVEFSVREGGGGSHGGVQFTQLNSTPSLSVVSAYDCVTGEFTLTAQGGSNFTWSPGTFLNTTVGSPVISTPTSAITYTVNGTSNCTGNPPASAQITVEPSHTQLDPDQDFGDGEWIVFGYDGNNFGTYSGYYTEPQLTFDSRDRWGSNNAPSDATGYVGCTIPANQHSTRHKRTNFACGEYQIDVTNHDDYADLIIDGVTVWSHTGCCDSHTNAWTGFLGPASEVEFSVREFGGGSHGGLQFTQLNTNPGLSIADSFDCVTGEHFLTASGGTGFTWSPGTDLNMTTGPDVISLPQSTITYTVSGTSDCAGNPPATATITVDQAPASYDPDTDFGSGEWLAFCYDGNNYDTYQGYYVEPNLTFDSRDRWGSGSTPSNASGYLGCDIPENNHSVRYKREGFPCANYTLNLTNHDDHVNVFVDGVLVLNHNGCCDSHAGIYIGQLDGSSTVELQWREFSGGSHGGLEFAGAPAATTWLGGTNDWFTGSNWDNGVPGLGTTTVIPSGTPNDPIINSTDAECGDLTVDNGATLSIANSGSIDITGSFNCQGTFVPATSTVNFSGSCGASTLSVNGTLSFYDVIINKSSNFSITSGNVQLINSLTLQAGVFNTGNALTVISDINGTGRIAEITGGSITGDITMERYIPAGATNWRFLTSAVQGATLGDWNDDFVTSGYTGSQFPSFPFTSILTYDETISGTDQDNGYVNAVSASQVIEPAQGLWVWCGDNSNGTASFVTDLSGPPHTGSIDRVLEYTNSGFPDEDGWNMVGNPYPSPIDFSNLTITGSSENRYYVHDPQSGNTEMWDEALQTSTYGLADGNIASSQAFWIHHLSAGNVNFTEAAKTANAGGIFRAPREENEIALRLRSEHQSFYDRTVIRFDEDATRQYDRTDALKLNFGHQDAPHIASLQADGRRLCMQSLPSDEAKESVLITVETKVPGRYEISAEPGRHFEASCVRLEDLENHQMYLLEGQQTYTFVSTDSLSQRQFLLHFDCESQEAEAQLIGCYPNPTEQGVTLQWSEVPGTLQIEVYHPDGRLMASQSGNGTLTQFVNMSDWASGVYLYRLITPQGTTTRRVIRK